jgi:hypothetical protein
VTRDTLFYIRHLHRQGHPPTGWTIELEVIRPPALADEGELDSAYVWPFQLS